MNVTKHGFCCCNHSFFDNISINPYWIKKCLYKLTRLKLYSWKKYKALQWNSKWQKSEKSIKENCLGKNKTLLSVNIFSIGKVK